MTINKFPFAQYMANVNAASLGSPTWRYGQILSNVLNDGWPKIADQIRGTEYDPFHADKGDHKIDMFFSFLFRVTL